MLSIFCSSNIWAQYNIQHQPLVAFERAEDNLLEFSVTGLSRGDIQEANLFYRYDGDFSYQQQEIELQNGVFSTVFNVENENAGSVEYYLEINLLSGESLYYPANLPSENPVRVEIIEKREIELQTLEEVDFTILSPRPGKGVTTDDALIALALFYDSADLDEGEFRLLLDNTDVTELADTSTYYISYIPSGLRSGAHKLALHYVTDDETFLVTEWEFFVVGRNQASFKGFDKSKPVGQAELTARNQVLAGDINNAYTGRTRLSGTYGALRYSLNGYFTSQESNRLQPQNRYGIRLEINDWWKFEAGHVFPSMSRFTISGRRINGINTSLHLFNENINFQFIHGELGRSIDNLYGSLEIQQIESSAGVVVDTSYTLRYSNQGRGAFKRDITGGRVGFGNPEKFQLGFQALKVQDDTTSLYNIRDYYDLSNNPDFRSKLSSADDAKLQQNPGLLNIEGGSLRPRDNLLIGTDLRFGLHNNRIRFESEAVVSALNDDIYGGAFSVERADELGFDIDQKQADLLEQLSWLIIINENMNTIPIRFSDDENGESETGFFFPTSIIASNSELSFRYPTNNFRLQYRWIGPNFNSLANSTIRKDIAGFTLTDRFNLLSNRLYITLGYENLNDNVVGNRETTTNTDTYRTNASWYPVTKDLPRVSLGFRYRIRDNGVARFNPEVPVGFENAAVQNLRIAENGDTLTTTYPRTNNTINFNTSITQQISLLDMLHDLSLNFSTLKTTDEVFAFGDVKSSAVSLNVTSRFSNIPLRSQLGITFNNTETGSGQSSVNIFGIYAGGNYFLMDNQLSLNGRFAITSNKTSSRIVAIEDNGDTNSLNNYYFLGDEIANPSFATYALQAGAEYTLNEYHALIFDANLTNVSGQNRANDRIVQLRYVFRF
ncbi:MAG: hypothetical protein WD016_03775 [Balneolaceae bacterium]